MWLESGWAIDARLGSITREHEDIDVAYAKDKEEEYENLLSQLGFKGRESTDYGFLIYRNSVLLDTEPCLQTKDGYSFKDFPSGSCPARKEGHLDGFPIRCVSWEAMYYEFLYYLKEIPREKWRSKDFESFKIVTNHVPREKKSELEELFHSNYPSRLV